MFKNKFRFGMATVVLIVILRLSLGCHFLYEGVWKITHPEFTAEGFLVQAKGPAASIFHAMIPDIDGRQRLNIERVVSGKGILDAWRKVRDDSEKRYRVYVTKPYQEKLDEGQKLSAKDELAIEEIVKEFRGATEPILWQGEDKLDAFLAKNEQTIHAFFEAQKKEQSAEKKEAFTKKVKSWLSTISDIQTEYFTALKEFAKNDKDAVNAVARSVNQAARVFDEGVVVDKLVSDNRLRSPKGQEILRITRSIRAEKFSKPWNDLKQKVIRKYGLDDRQKAEAEIIYRRYKNAVKSVLAENQEEIAVYFEALDRFEKRRAAGNQGALHQKKRLYDKQQELRKEVGVWLSGLEATEKGYQTALASLLTQEQIRMGALPVPWTRTDLINFAVTWGLTAIGFCLLVGLFTRPAALGGGLFMLFVVLTQPAWPTIYPPDPAIVGHALLINKDFVEMIALFTLATTAAGRWGGLDCFVENFILGLCRSCKNKKDKEEGKQK